MGKRDGASLRLGALRDHLGPTNHYDVAVVGLGVLGSSAAFHAARRGVKVVGFEQFEFGHVRGASHDTSRIVRTSYELPQYVALAQSAYKGWAELELAAKQQLLTITGGVVIFPKDGTPNATQWAKGLEANGLPYELLNAEQANKRWPQFSIKDDQEVIYSDDSGIVHAAKAVSAFQAMARFYGADLKEHTKVERVMPQGSGGTIETSKGRFTADKIILAGDAWINELLRPLDSEIPVTVTQEQVTYFKPTNPEDYTPEKFPVWVLTGKQWYYGFPCYGEPSIKCGHDNTGIQVTGDNRSFVPDPRIYEELASSMQSLMPDPGRKTVRTVTCLYTLTPDRQFVIAPLPKHEGIIVTLGAGHAFKYAPVIGRIATELAIDGETREDISLFGFPTPEMLANPRRSKIAG